MQIQGIYENVIGIGEREKALRYFAELGYQPVTEGRLEAEAARALYGVDSGLTSLRLQNGQTATHGLLRLLIWDKTPAPGLGDAQPLSMGSRWFTSRTNDIVRLRDAYLDDIAAGQSWVVSDLVRQVIREGRDQVDFYQQFVGVREMMVLGRETRQVYFQRYGYDVPDYGTISPDSPLQVSESTHAGIVVANFDSLDFYSEVLGLKLEKVSEAPPAQPPVRPELIMSGTTPMLGPLMRHAGETYRSATFVTPSANVGRLYVVSPQDPSVNLQERTHPGVSGLCLITYRVNPITEYHRRVSASPATAVTPLLPNEFGEPSFTFTAPDGTAWDLVGSTL